MLRRASVRIAAATLILAFSTPATTAIAQEPNPAQAEPTWSEAELTQIVGDVQRSLRRLTTFGVFDWLTFSIQGKTLILKGYASRPILSRDAEGAVRRIRGIDRVENQIVVLPLSNFDDRIRAQVYTRIYTQPALRRYNANRGSIAQAMGPGGRRFNMMAGGITNNPPLGFHAIHIIVNRGHVSLFGSVSRESDSNIAYIQARGTPGVFSVENNLFVENPASGGGE